MEQRFFAGLKARATTLKKARENANDFTLCSGVRTSGGGFRQDTEAGKKNNYRGLAEGKRKR